jgi:hypothetical protein
VVANGRPTLIPREVALLNDVAGNLVLGTDPVKQVID